MEEDCRLVDARGLICPEPLMMVHAAVRDAAAGELIRVLATDPSTERDLKRFCDFLNHELLEITREGQECAFLLRKGGRPAGT